MASSRGVLCLVLIAGAALLAGCEAEVNVGDNDLNTADAEKNIKDQYPADAGGLTLTKVDCGTTEAEVGNTFTCEATNSAGLNLEIEGTIDRIDEDTDEAHFETKVVKAVSDGTLFAREGKKALMRDGRAVVSMKCPEILIKKGVVTKCDMTMDNGSKQIATITLTDNTGVFNIKTSGVIYDQ